MLFLHEVHKVVGRKEEEFEAAYRDYWMPTMAKSDYARLLWYTNHALGSGVSYNVVTVTAIKDGRAWEDLARRVQKGDLQSWMGEVDTFRHDVVGKVLVPLEWSPVQEFDLDAHSHWTGVATTLPCTWRTPCGRTRASCRSTSRCRVRSYPRTSASPVPCRFSPSRWPCSRPSEPTFAARSC